jgi:hypothetical protein
VHCAWYTVDCADVLYAGGGLLMLHATCWVLLGAYYSVRAVWCVLASALVRHGYALLTRQLHAPRTLQIVRLHARKTTLVQ